MPLIYILTNKWYQADNMYKVGRHCGDNINDLLNQYSARYMPGRELIQYWYVDDCITMEYIVHVDLSLASNIERVEGEWFRGPIDHIVDIIDKCINRSIQDEYILRINYDNENIRIYPLSYLPLDRLKKLGMDQGIANPFAISSSKWKPLQIQLLLHQDKIIKIYESGGNINKKSQEKWSTLTGYPPDDTLISKLYLLVKTEIDNQIGFNILSHITNTISDNSRRSGRISSLKKQGKMPITYNPNETTSSSLIKQLKSQSKIQDKDYENMTSQELDLLLDQLISTGRSYIQPKINKIRALHNPELIPFLIEEGKRKKGI